MDNIGGYDFEVVGELVKEYECPICLLLIKNAMELPCTHGLCDTCLRKWEDEPLARNSGLRCPSCKNAYQHEQVKQNKIVDRVITTSLQVKCKEHKSGCDWEGKISDYTNHEKKCLFKYIECSSFGCNIESRRIDHDEHKKICSYRLIQCSFCSKQEQFCNLQEHYQKCIACPVDCMNEGCDIKIEKKKLNDHIQRFCHFQKVYCEYTSVGCDCIIQRKDLQDHIDTSMQHHMTLLLQNRNITTSDLNTKIAYVEEMIAETTEELTKSKLKSLVKFKTIKEDLNTRSDNTDRKLAETTNELDQTKIKLSETEAELNDTNRDLNQTKMKLVELEKKLKYTQQQNFSTNDKKFEEILKNIKTIEDNSLQSTKLLSLICSSNTLYKKSKVNNISSLMETLHINPCMALKEKKDINVDFCLEKELGIKLGEKNTNDKHVEILEQMKHKIIVENDILFPNMFIKVIQTMAPYEIYLVGNNDIYVKVELSKYIGKTLKVYMHDLTQRKSYETNKKTIYYSDQICLWHYGNDFRIYFFLHDWRNNNTNACIIHPQRNEEIQNGSTVDSYRFTDTLKQEYMLHGEILIKINKI